MAMRGKSSNCRWALPAACLLLLLLPLRVWAQQAVLEVRVAGEAGEPVATVTVIVRSLPDSVVLRSAETDRAGRVRLTGLPAARYVVTAERIGFAARQQQIELVPGRTAVVDLVLRAAAVGLPGVVVEAERRRTRFEESAGATVAELTQRDLKLLPAAGEADVLRAIEMLPGVVSTSDFSASFNVRGGSADQNLILLDGLPIYNPFHLGGFFSVFNADMIERAEMLTGGFPAQYGGRVSSVLSIESDAGRPGFDVQMGISILAARVAAGVDLPEGALRTAGMRDGRARLSVRRSYFDQLLRPFFDFPYHLTDLQGYAEAWTAGGGRVTLTGYTGRDVLDLSGTDSFPLRVLWRWGNDVAGASWARPLGSGRELTVRAGHSRFTTDIRFPEFDDTEFRSEINQSLLRGDFTGSIRSAAVAAGAAVDRLWYDNLAASGGTVFGGGSAQGWLLGSYAQLRMEPADWLIESGVRVDSWRSSGEPGVVVVQPRLAAKRFFSGRDYAVKGAVGRYAQFAHSLRDEELPLGIDIWVLTGSRAPHVVSDQVQLGVEGYASRSWFGGVEAYVRRFDGVTAVNPADDPNDPGDDLLAGHGLSYGADAYVRRELGRLRPMLAVSWLKAWREFDDPVAGSEPPPRLRYAPIFDRRVDVDFVLQAMLPRGVELGVRWNMGTGLPYTRPIGAYARYDFSLLDLGWRVDGEATDTMSSAIVLGPRNAERYPTYHRLDASVRKTYVKRWGTLTPHADLLNLYDRRNVLFYFYQYGESPPTRTGISMFPLLPTVGLEARF
jgi:hypothetical protein